MQRKLFLLVILVFGVVSLHAQQTVSGTVYAEDHTPLSGAEVFVEGHSTVGATTNDKGQYSLELKGDKKVTLIISFVGYAQTSFIVEPGKGQIKKDFFLKEDAMMLEGTVVTGTRTPKLLKDVPILTKVISLEEIRQSTGSNIGDLLQEELPGIEFTYVMNQQTSLNMQGFGGNAVLFLVDGERLAGETLDNIDYSRLNLDNVERVEIVKGAASSLYGSNAVGGVVNLITKRSRDPWNVNLNAFLSSNQQQRYGTTVDFNVGKVNNSFSFQFDDQATIDLDNPGDYDAIYGSRAYNFKDKLVYAPLDNLQFTARLGYFFRQRDSQESIKERYRSANGGIKGNYKINDANDLELAYTFDQYDKSDYLVLDDKDYRDYSNVQHIVRGIYNHTFKEKHILTVGGDFMRDYLMSYQFTDGDHIQYTTDLFAQFDWNPFDRFNVIAGVRYDYFSEADLHHVSPKLGLMYKFDHFSIRGSYAGGFRAPTLKEMYMNFDMASIFMIYGNPDLKPESSHNFSISGEYMHKYVNASVTGFHNIVANRITTIWDKEKNGMVYTNMADLTVSGVDANVTFKHSCGIGAKISYSYVYEHIAKGEPLVSSTRPHTATFKVNYGRDWENKFGFNVALTGRYLSKVTVDEYTSSNSYEETEERTYPGYTIWKLNVALNLYRGVNLNLTADNIFNYIPEYYSYNSPSTIGTVISAGLCINIEELTKKNK